MMRKLTILFVLMISVLSLSVAQNMVKVTVQVDLNELSDFYEGGGAWVFLDADWNEYFDMTDNDGDGIFTYTIEKEAGSTLAYRFSYQNGEDPWSNYTEEPVPVECANADGFREILLPAHNISLDAIKYGQCPVTPVDVTFQVDLNNVEDLFEGGTVWVYMDAGWSEYYDMTDDNGDGIYSFTLQREVGSTLTYRFAYQNGADPWTNYVEENVPEACDNADGFRELMVLPTSATLPPFVLGSCDDIPTGKVNITFQVNMSAEENPNDVQVVIKNPWIWTSLTDQGDGIWSATVEVDANATYPFTFVNGGQDNWGEEESVPEECNFGTESAPERHVEVIDEDVVLDIVAFGSCNNDAPVDKMNVTFMVDINGVPDFYEGGAVWVFMDADWNEYYDMTDDDGDGIYTFTVEREAGATLPYRFAYQNGEDPWSNYIEEIVPEACANADGFREILVPPHDISLDVIPFGTCAEDPVSITFQVDLNYVNDLYEDGAVWVYMDAGWAEYYDMTDDDGDGIYTFTVERAVGSTLPYRFSYQNGEDPWSNYIEEKVPEDCANADGFREFMVPNMDVTLQTFVFGSCDDTFTETPRVNITFQVDMLGEDNPNNVMVVIKNPWIWTALEDQGNGTWSATVEVDGNSTYPFTYVNGGQDNWDEEESVPEACNFGTESAPERHVVVETEDVVLDLVSFGECDFVNNIEDLLDSGYTIYPNPSHGSFTIKLDKDELRSVQLYDMNGRLIKDKVFSQGAEARMDVQSIEKGIYMLRINAQSGSKNTKLIIE